MGTHTSGIGGGCGGLRWCGRCRVSTLLRGWRCSTTVLVVFVSAARRAVGIDSEGSAPNGVVVTVVAESLLGVKLLTLLISNEYKCSCTPSTRKAAARSVAAGVATVVAAKASVGRTAAPASTALLCDEEASLLAIRQLSVPHRRRTNNSQSLSSHFSCRASREASIQRKSNALAWMR